MGRFVVIWALAAALLGSMRLLASWGARQDPADIPDVLRTFLPDAPPAQNSELSFDPLFHHFGELLEGEVVETGFPFVNDGDAPVTILRARHCGCVKVEFPRDTPIAPGESAVLVARLDTNGRTDVQVKPIELFTDEEGEGPHTGVLLKGNITSPIVFRRANVVWYGASPGERREWTIPFAIGDEAGRPELGVDADFVSARLDLDGDEGELVIDVEAPRTSGVAQTDLLVHSKIESGSWEGEDWTKAIRVRVTVRAPFRVLGKAKLDGDGRGDFKLNLSRPDEEWVRELRIDGAPLEVRRERGDDRSRIQEYAILRSGPGEIPTGATVDVYSNLSGDTPTFQIPILLPDGDRP